MFDFEFQKFYEKFLMIFMFLLYFKLIIFMFLYYFLIFFKKYIEIVSDCETRPRKFENLKIFSFLQNNIYFLKNILMCLTTKRDPWNLKILNFFLYFKIIFWCDYIKNRFQKIKKYYLKIFFFKYFKIFPIFFSLDFFSFFSYWFFFLYCKEDKLSKFFWFTSYTL
jgi:hypothetical protein